MLYSSRGGHCFLLSCCVLVGLCLFPLATASDLKWHNITNPLERGALCNDFTPAGYFLATNPTSDKWIIFLEGGGGCTSVEQCNERYIAQEIRRQFIDSKTNKINIVAAWNAYKHRQDIVISKLMTSLWRYRSSADEWIIKGTDLLSSDPISNPAFHDYNRVLVPYCSSDLWLGSSTNYDQLVSRNTTQQSQRQFVYNPASDTNQFTFRGVAIFRSVLSDLDDYNGLNSAVSVILAGSSAGGIGVLNHLPWLKNELGDRVQISAITDSAWFIDFKGSLRSRFIDFQDEIVEEQNDLPCGEELSDCIFTESLLSLPTYPTNVPIMVTFSTYDLYLLAAFLSNATANELGIIRIMRIASEYSGSMMNSLLNTVNRRPMMSYFVTSCFQHVYLANSDLWGANALLGQEAIDESLMNNQFRHIVEQGVWNRLSITRDNDTLGPSLLDALYEWVSIIDGDSNDTVSTVRIRDHCEGPRCNPTCPELVILGYLTPYWGSVYQLIVLSLVFLITGVSVVMKILLYFRFWMLKKVQKMVIEEFAVDPYKGLESGLPMCDEKEAISVACLHLRHSITLSNAALKKAAASNNFDGGHRYKRLLSAAATSTLTTNPETSADYKRRVSALPQITRTRINKRDIETGQVSDPLEEEEEAMEQDRQHNAQVCDLAATIQQFNASQAKQKDGLSKRKAGILHKDSKRQKEIISGVSAYFNPGELVAVMGPSGCGKTTFTDLMAGRRNVKPQKGSIFINGTSLHKIYKWYITRTGYVLQLATPYYHSLTVRENLTMAAQMRLPDTVPLEKKLRRVEQILNETGLTALANTMVGTDIGPGLSGGQKKRLCIALQLINLPSLVFLDEPTSGLDATSSLELLTYLNKLSSSNRTVVLTIHQPRLEIFHMFTKIVLLCKGKIAYHGVPEKVYQFFVDAQINASLHVKKVGSLESNNPADIVMDMLGSEESSLAILEHYSNTSEDVKVVAAIEKAIADQTESLSDTKLIGADFFNRICALDARAQRHSKLSQILYLPFVFTLYGILLGSVYFQTQNATFILSAFGVFSCASGLFLFPIMFHHLYPALQLFHLEYSDGVGKPLDLIIQTFLRFSSLSVLPLLTGSTTLYLLVIPYTQYKVWRLLLFFTGSLSLNLTWISIVIFLVTAIPNHAHRVSPILSAIAGFSSGFFVPPGLMPKWYIWLFYVNPNYYGFSSVARLILEDIKLDCQYESPIECYPTTGNYLLTYFSLHQINPFLHILILLAMSISLLSLSWLLLSFRLNYTRLLSYLKSVGSSTHTADEVRDQVQQNERRTSLKERRMMQRQRRMSQKERHIPLRERRHRVCYESDSSSSLSSISSNDDVFIGESKRMGIDRRRRLHMRQGSMMLNDQDEHEVWKPGKKLSRRLNSIVDRRKSMYRSIKEHENELSCRASNKDLIEKRKRQWRNLETGADRVVTNIDDPLTMSGGHVTRTSSIKPKSKQHDGGHIARTASIKQSLNRDRPMRRNRHLMHSFTDTDLTKKHSNSHKAKTQTCILEGSETDLGTDNVKTTVHRRPSQELMHCVIEEEMGAIEECSSSFTFNRRKRSTVSYGIGKPTAIVGNLEPPTIVVDVVDKLESVSIERGEESNGDDCNDENDTSDIDEVGSSHNVEIHEV